MQTKNNHILVGCDDSSETLFLQNLFADITPLIEVSVANNLKDLLNTLVKRLPDVIVLHVIKQGEGYFEWLKKIRSVNVKGIDEVPVLIYTGRAGKADIPGLLALLFEGKKLKKPKKKAVKKGGKKK